MKSAGVFLGWSHLVWIHILALPLAGYISLSKLLNHSVLCFFLFVCLFVFNLKDEDNSVFSTVTSTLCSAQIQIPGKDSRAL